MKTQKKDIVSFETLCHEGTIYWYFFCLKGPRALRKPHILWVTKSYLGTLCVSQGERRPSCNTNMMMILGLMVIMIYSVMMMMILSVMMMIMMILCVVMMIVTKSVMMMTTMLSLMIMMTLSVMMICDETVVVVQIVMGVPSMANRALP